MSKENTNQSWQDVYSQADTKELLFTLLTKLVSSNILSQLEADDIVRSCIWVSEPFPSMPGVLVTRKATAEIVNGKVKVIKINKPAEAAVIIPKQKTGSLKSRGQNHEF